MESRDKVEEPGPPFANFHPAALVLDFDGTIVDTESTSFEAARAAYETHGLVLDLTDWRRVVGRTDQPHWTVDLQSRVDTTLDLSTLRSETRRRKTAMSMAQPLRDGIAELITCARATGVGVAIASSSPREWGDAHLDRLGITSHFDAIATAGGRLRSRPRPDTYLEACRALGLEPGTCLAIEDSVVGCSAAVTAGLRCVAIPNDITAGQDFAAVGVDVVVTHPAELRLF